MRERNSGQVNSLVFVSGHRATGKTTASKFLGENGFQIYDTGPKIREHVTKSKPGEDFEIAIEQLIDESGDTRYVENFFIDDLNRLLEHESAVVTGYRNFSDLFEAWDNLRHPGKKNSPFILYMSAEFESALTYFKRREKLDESYAREILKRDWENEVITGILSIKEHATFIVENNSKKDEFLREVGKKVLNV